MKNLLFLCGPNGIGKTTICNELLKKISNSAYVDSDPCRMMNPFILNDETIPTIANNISSLIHNYLNCPLVNTVIFSYGFHGRRKEVFNLVMNNLSETAYHFIPLLLWCSEEENIRRMKIDDRSNERIHRAITESRMSFNNVNYPKIDITNLSILESTEYIIRECQL